MSGILIHAGMRQGSSRELAVANTCACLGELRHYSDAGSSYPGDVSCELQPLWENNPVLAHAYFGDLGDDLTCPQLDFELGRLSDYIWLSTLSPATPQFEKARQASLDSHGNNLLNRRLHTMATSRLPATSRRIEQDRENALMHGLLENWIDWSQRGKPRSTSLPSTESSDLVSCDKIRWDFTSQFSEALNVFNSSAGNSPEQFARSLVDQIVIKCSPAPQSDVTLSVLDRFLDVRQQSVNSTHPIARLINSINDHLRPLADKACQGINDHIDELLDRARVRLPGASQALRGYASQVDKVYLHARSQVEANESECDQIRQQLQLSKPATTPQPSASNALIRYAHLRIQQVIHRAIQSNSAHLMRQLNAISQNNV